MWTLIKTIFAAMVLAAAAYGVLFCDLGGQTLAEHALEVWHTPVVRDKLAQMRLGLREHLEAKLANDKMPTAQRRLHGPTGGAADNLTADDRQALDDVLRQMASRDSRKAQSSR